MFFVFDSKPFKFKYKNSWAKWECFSLKKIHWNQQGIVGLFCSHTGASILFKVLSLNYLLFEDSVWKN